MASAAKKAKVKRGMGRGLAAILPETTATPTVGELRELPVDLIKPNPKQPRTKFDAAPLARGASGGIGESARGRARPRAR